jgi:flagellar biosynthesis activator protein FlaF
MQNAAQAYAKTQQQTSNPRELEANLLMRAASRLQLIKDSWPEKQGELTEALTYNRKLWTVFLSSMADDNCGLPKEIRSNIASLATFVLNHSIRCVGTDDPNKLNVLINMNRSIALGLRSSAPQQAA